MPCVHSFVASKHPDYEVCERCGTYHSTLTIDREAIYRNEYWHGKHGLSTLSEQVYNVAVHKENGVTKNEFVLARLNPPDAGCVIEIGCAPGSLLGTLSKRFNKAVGLEVDAGYARDILRIGDHGFDLFFGMFPDSTKHFCDESASCIIGLDIIEHADDPVAFLAECNRLLKPQGQLLLMTPFAQDTMPDRMFHPEHVWLFSQNHLDELLREQGFGHRKYDAWCPGHETVSAIKL